MTYVVELTREEMSNLSVELECLIAEYEQKAKEARQINSGAEPYFTKWADRLKQSLEKIQSAKIRRD